MEHEQKVGYSQITGCDKYTDYEIDTITKGGCCHTFGLATLFRPVLFLP
jgi:hypothetical protein